MELTQLSGVGTRSPYRNGRSVVLTLPKDEILNDSDSLDPTDLVGTQCRYRLGEGTLIIDLSGD